MACETCKEGALLVLRSGTEEFQAKGDVRGGGSGRSESDALISIPEGCIWKGVC